MKKRHSYILILFIVSLLSVGVSAQDNVFVPKGSYLKSSENVKVTIKGDFKKMDGSFVYSELTYYANQASQFSNIINNNGKLVILRGEHDLYSTHSFFPYGSYLQSAKENTLQVVLNATCKDKYGHFIQSKPLAFLYSEKSEIKDISNNNGNLELQKQNGSDEEKYGSRKDGFVINNDKKDSFIDNGNDGKYSNMSRKNPVTPEFLKISDGEGDKGIVDMETDEFGNIYVVGFFRDAMKMGEKTYTCLANADAPVYFYAKFSPQAEVIWLKQFEVPTSGNRVTAEKIEIDENKNIYIYGLFIGKQNFNRTGGYKILENNTGESVEFLAKYNPNGELFWAKGFKNGFYAGTRDFVVDKAGNSYLLGFYANVAKIDSEGNEIFREYLPNGFTPGAICLYKDKIFIGTKVKGDYAINLTLENGKKIAIPKIGKAEGYFHNTEAMIACLSAKTGKMIWADFIRSPYSEEINGIGVDAKGNVTVLGTCAPNALLGLEEKPFGKYSASKKITFLTQYDMNGNRNWIKDLKVKDKALQGVYGVSLEVDKATGDIYTTRAHCNKGFSWAVYFEKHNRNGQLLYDKTFGYSEEYKGNNGFYKSSCGTANFFTHLNTESNSLFLFGEGRDYNISHKNFGLDGNKKYTKGTDFFIAKYGL